MLSNCDIFSAPKSIIFNCCTYHFWVMKKNVYFIHWRNNRLYQSKKKSSWRRCWVQSKVKTTGSWKKLMHNWTFSQWKIEFNLRLSNHSYCRKIRLMLNSLECMKKLCVIMRRKLSINCGTFIFCICSCSGGLPVGRTKEALVGAVQDLLHHCPHTQAGEDLPPRRHRLQDSPGHWGHRP